ncbi:hypothetical protein ACWD0E_26365, partial [Streptomyces sp. NPDC003002]
VVVPSGSLMLPSERGAGPGSARVARRSRPAVVARLLRWRNSNARHPDVLAAQRKERARIRSEKGIRWGGCLVTEAA